MDRIYFFRLAKEENGYKGRNGEGSRELPVFRMETQLHEIYYLQMYATVKSEELAEVQSYMAKGIRRIAGWYGDEESHNEYIVYDPPFENWLWARQRADFWQKTWNLPLYQEYEESCNLLFLLRQPILRSVPGNLIILGEAPGIQEWIGLLAKHMKKIIFFSLTKPKGFEQLREWMLSEYGLLADWAETLQPVSREPALILDYSGREKIYIWGVARGSIWIDMTSMEARRHALQDRDTGIQYISLKCFWQEEMLQTLDTVGKIKYNTEVKLEGKVGK